ncbi:hypothetical protein [Desulfolutivibrio sulfoxidireducens]|uniref:hypothetical protein n=1 Tax=Desulfolutivibrio sulfoxidireducens TaxID=2773299 RepID=UPI00159DCB98|nr:hypothetical protein [Desulfolutivibrio sulfoxidireducens]QLA18909.1 hypothetical protein GD604_03760 [Desulfolutivibrio sulfoxidireducens]
MGTILAGTALAQPLVATTPGGAVQAPSPDPVRAHPLEPPPGHPPAVAADPRQGERLLSGYRGCIERTVAQMAAGGGEPVRVAETAYGACRHLLALAEVEAGRRESLEQAAWSYALQTALGRMEGR